MIGRGISLQLFVAGVIPAAVVTVLVGAWLVTLRVADLREHHATLGQAVASQLAPAAEYGVFSGNTTVLQRLAEAALAEADLRTVTIRDRNGMVMAQATQTGEHAQAPVGAAPTWLAARLVDADETVRFTAPVLQAITDLGEFDLPRAPQVTAEIGTVEIEIAVQPGLASQLEAALTGVGILLAGLLISFMLALRLGERIAGPIERLANAMRRVRDGDLAVRVPETSTNELGQLESGLNRMADEVERTQQTLEDRIARATAELEQTIAALEISNVELDLARRRALEASHMKSDFLAAMSHEIRTPMSGIIGFARLLARAPMDPEQREQVATIERSADVLMNIINDILDLSRIEAGKLTLAEQPLDLRDCVDDVLALLAPLAYGKGLDLRRGVHRDVPRVLLGDAARIGQIVTNLASNAIKHTPAGSVSVEVTCAARSATHTTIAIAVTDTGIGIPTKLQRQLFKAFSQPSPAEGRQPGTGLGLVICNRLVEAMGGEIALDSEPGRGSRFAVTLELRNSPPVPADGPAPRWTGKRALWIDPDPLTRDHIAQRLEAMGLDVVADDTQRCDVLLFGLLDEGDPQLVRAETAAAGGVPVVALLASLDRRDVQRVQARLQCVCLPRCLTGPALERALASVLDGEEAVHTLGDLGQPLDGLHVLVTDDDRINRTLLRRQLELLGATVDDCGDGESAVAACGARHFDAVLLDMQMPGISGIEAARRIRTLPDAPLVIAVTANALPGRQGDTRAAGISEVLVKPVAEDRLAATIRSHLHRRQGITDALARLDADIREMLADDFPGHARAFRHALDAREPDPLRRALHDLEGTASVCDLIGLREAVVTLRRQLDDDGSGSADGVRAEVDAIEELLNKPPCNENTC